MQRAGAFISDIHFKYSSLPKRTTLKEEESVFLVLPANIRLGLKVKHNSSSAHPCADKKVAIGWFNQLSWRYDILHNSTHQGPLLLNITDS